MAHYALLNYKNIVTKVITGKDENSVDSNIELVYQNIFNQVCKRTSYNTIAGKHKLGGTPFRKNYAGVGYTYDYEKDAFISPQPYANWTLDSDKCIWRSPVEYPEDNKRYTWNEDTASWDLVSE